MSGIELPKGYELRPQRPEDQQALCDLWEGNGLITPWNDPPEDIRAAIDCPSSEIFLVEHERGLVGSVMVGYDGHRGWLYYLTVDEQARGRGLGGSLVRAAEAWLKARGVPKVQLIVRETNLGARDFYARLGYHPNPCSIMQRWLVARDAPALPGEEDGLLRFTVTYLEMTERPKTAAPPPPTRIKVALMRATRPSLAFYRFLYDRVGAPGLWWERRVMPDAALTEILQDDAVEVYVLYVEGVPAGFAELDRRDEPDIGIAYFGLMPEFIGMGLGPYLLHNAIDIAWSYEPKRLLVSTNTLDHARALPLYQRLGFHPIRREEEEVIDPRRSGVIPPWEA